MYVERSPSAVLAGRLACAWHRTSEVATTQLVVPDACVDLIWGPGGPFVAGPDTGPMPATLEAGQALVGVRFRPGAVGDLFGVPLEELRDRRVPVAELPGWSGLLTELTEALGPMPSGSWSKEARLDVLQAAVGRRLTAGGGRAAVDPASRAIAAGLGEGRTVSQVAWALGYSERQLRRRSLLSFGYPPKTLQRIVRFQHALRLARAGTPLAQVAATAGYADQAHLANDVKRLSGVPMGNLL
ncbi:DUF6597 domain-containing transcriptional factor [Nonomuraea sp. NPDC004297]